MHSLLTAYSSLGKGYYDIIKNVIGITTEFWFSDKHEAKLLNTQNSYSVSIMTAFLIYWKVLHLLKRVSNALINIEKKIPEASSNSMD